MELTNNLVGFILTEITGTHHIHKDNTKISKNIATYNTIIQNKMTIQLCDSANKNYRPK